MLYAAWLSRRERAGKYRPPGDASDYWWRFGHKRRGRRHGDRGCDKRERRLTLPQTSLIDTVVDLKARSRNEVLMHRPPSRASDTSAPLAPVHFGDWNTGRRPPLISVESTAVDVLADTTRPRSSGRARCAGTVDSEDAGNRRCCRTGWSYDFPEVPRPTRFLVARWIL